MSLTPTWWRVHLRFGCSADSVGASGPLRLRLRLRLRTTLVAQL